MSPRVSAASLGDAPSTRDVILDAAERRFAERGFAGVSMREIAAEAGLRNQASLYHHFRDKRALYEAVLGRGITALVALIAETSQDWPAGEVGRIDPEVMERVLDRVLDYLADHPHLPRLVERAGLDDSRFLRATATRILRPLWVQGLRVLQGSLGQWDEAELPHLGMGLYHLIFGYFADATLLEVVGQQDPRSAAAVARQRRFLATAVGLLLGVGGPRAGARGRAR